MNVDSKDALISQHIPNMIFYQIWNEKINEWKQKKPFSGL